MHNTLVIIPARNEEDTIYEVVTRSLNHADICVIDDGSEDRTPELLTKIKMEAASGLHPNHVHIITHKKATHIPGGIQDGLRFGIGKKYEFYITMDAGLSHDPDALPTFLEYDPSVHVLIGSREKVKGAPLYRRMISWGAARIMNYALSREWKDFKGPGLRDCTSGFRRYSAIGAGLIAEAELKSKAFDFHMEALAICVRAGLNVREIPIEYNFSNSSFTRKVLWLAIKFAWHLIKTKKDVKQAVPAA